MANGIIIWLKGCYRYKNENEIQRRIPFKLENVNKTKTVGGFIKSVIF